MPIPVDQLKTKLLAIYSQMIAAASQPGFYGHITLTTSFEDGSYRIHEAVTKRTEKLVSS